MKTIPRAKPFAGKQTTVYTTVPRLISLPVGSCCLYVTKDTLEFCKRAQGRARKFKGRVHTEPLLAIDLKDKNVLGIVRVTVIKTGRFRLPVIFRQDELCAPSSVLSRCTAGSAAVYENIGDLEAIKSLRRSFQQNVSHGIFWKCYLIDIRTGTNKPIYYAEVHAPGKPYKFRQPADFDFYRDYMP